ncbi:hypothetical protein [Streptomyces sp. NPDC093089]|uniref:hypothetical protein n=1 Tax=Streptomyces sp. NPDC093089 TaxID=3366024 RepID=UPI0038005555
MRERDRAPGRSRDEHAATSAAVTGLSWVFFAIGVVITLGAATGMTRRDRGTSFRAALTKTRRSS